MTDANTDILIKQIETISINEPEPVFYVDNEDLNPDKKFFITKIRLDFYQLWCIFGEIPIIHKRGKCKYEWIVRQKNSNRIFSIYDWNNKNKLMNTTQWYIRSNIQGDTGDFLKTLSDAIECYNLYYKDRIEKKTFDEPICDLDEHSDIVDQVLHEIKNTFIENLSLLKSL